MRSSVSAAIVTATQRCLKNVYGWACCEWSKFKGGQKDLVSFITHCKRVGWGEWGGFQSNHSRVYCNSGGLSSPEVQAHCTKWRNRSRRKEERTELWQEILQLGGKCRLKASGRRGVTCLKVSQQPPENLYGWRWKVRLLLITGQVED